MRVGRTSNAVLIEELVGAAPDLSANIWLVGIAEGQPKLATSLHPLTDCLAIFELYFEADHEAFVDWVWEHTEFDKLIALASDKEVLKQYQRAGFKREGVARNSLRTDAGELTDQWYVGLSRPV